MSIRLSKVTLATLLILLPLVHRAAAAIERSVSTSKQFLIYGADVRLRGAISELAEQAKFESLTLLQRRDSWETPIVLNLRFPQANAPEVPRTSFNFSQTGAGLKLQLDLTVAADFDPTIVRRDLLRAILIELIYREHATLAVGSPYVEPPDWLLDGLLALAPGQDRTTIVAALQAPVSENNILPLEQFLRQKPELLDSPARQLYGAYSYVLVGSLMRAPEGRARLGRYIMDLEHATNDPLADLRTHFPSLPNNNILVENQWREAVAESGSANRFQLLTVFETEKRLRELLETKIPDAIARSKTYSLEEIAETRRSKPRVGALQALSEEFLLLATRAHPVMRPVIGEYQHAASHLALNKKEGVDLRLARATITRARLLARMRSIDDYLNWFEATQSPKRSAAFGGYFKAAAEGDRKAPRRRDPLSIYLDALEEQFH